VGIRSFNAATSMGALASTYTANAPAALLFGSGTLLSDVILYGFNEKTQTEVYYEKVIEIVQPIGLKGELWGQVTKAGVKFVIENDKNLTIKKNNIRKVENKKEYKVLVGSDLSGNLIYSTLKLKDD